VPLLIGGNGAAAVRRTVEYGVGWTSGGAPPDQIARIAAEVREAWRRAGRDGEPRILALAYFSLGDEVEQLSYRYLRHYYAGFGDDTEVIASNAFRSAGAIRDALPAYADAGVNELILDPTVAELSQIDRLADAVL
jgi:alkanesulfonate monooxygenase SsuD/methylene tetrahydromethanopterin reductase-like flavin-dependent oxidoreductase (luciferase family)